MSSSNEKKSGILNNTILLLAGIMALGFAIRLIPMAYSIVDGQVIFPEFDPYYHMRRITYTIEHFPFASIYDSYVNYPEGYLIGWPPLYDLIAAALSLITGLGSPDRTTIEITSAMLPVILGVITIIPLFFIVKKALGERTALIASLVMAILPASVFRTIFGFTDHHALEVLLSLLLYLFFITALSYARKEWKGFKGMMNKNNALIYSIIAGIFIALMIFTWDGAPLFIGVIIAYSFFQYIYDAFNKEGPDSLTFTGLVSSVTALILVAPFAATSYMGQKFVVSAIYLSWFHILFLIGTIIFFLFMGVASRALAERKAPWYSLPAVSIAFLIAGILGLKLFMPQFFANLEEGIKFLTGGSKILQSIVEVEPLYKYNGAVSFEIPWIFFSTVSIIALLGFIAYAALYIPGKKVREPELFLLIWTVIVLILGILQKRFVYLLAVNASIFAGFAIYEALKLAGFEKTVTDRKQRKKQDKAGKGSMSPAVLSVALVSAILLIPVLLSTINLVSSQEFYSKDWNVASAWLRDNTPPTSHTYSADMGTMPEYGVMTWWDYGNYVLYRGERPAISNNFQTGVDDSSRFFIAQNESFANSIMDRRNAKYVMVDLRMSSPYAVQNYPGIFHNMPYIAGDDPSTYIMTYRMPDPLTTNRYYDGNDKYYNSMYSRLFNDNGMGGLNSLGLITNGLERYRMVYETNGDDPVKIFEYVKGARITGKAAPNSVVELNLTLRTPSNKFYTNEYYSKANADANGYYSFIVPYPTNDQSQPVKTLSKYTIRSSGLITQVDVPVDAVAGGKEIPAGDLK